jgi:transposase
MRPKGTASELEARRMRAAQLLDSGMKAVDVARSLECSESAVSRWKKELREKGVAGLKAKPVPGRPSFLSDSQKEELKTILLRGPKASGYPTDLWTCRRVAEVIERTFDVRYHPNAVWFVLRSLGWTCQKPERRARERDEAAIESWRREAWPHIKKGS